MKTLQSPQPIFICLFYAALACVTVLLLWPFPPKPPEWPGKDKLEHLIVFATLATLGGLAHRRHLKQVVFGLLAYGIATELLQALLTSTRQASVADWLADAAGIALGVVIYRKLQSRK